MKIPKSITNNWKTLYDRGDQTKISTKSKIDSRKISKAFKGEGDQKTIEAISSFYRDRKDAIKTI